MNRENKKRVAFGILWVLILVAIAIILTHLLPPHTYDSEIIESIHGRREILDGTRYHEVPEIPLRVDSFFRALITAFTASLPMLAMFFLVLFLTSVIETTESITGALGKLAGSFKTSQAIFIPGSMILFAFLGATLGMEEALLPFIPLYVALTLSLGYDSLTGVAIVLCGASAGFTASLTNPFTVLFAQEILSLPLYSGFFFRTMLFVIFLVTSIRYVMRHASRVIEDPRKSPVHEIDQDRAKVDRVDFPACSEGTCRILILLMAAMLLLPLLATLLQWHLGTVMGFFALLTFPMVLLGGLKARELIPILHLTLSRFLPLFLLVVFSRAVPLILEEGRVLHSLIHEGVTVLMPLSSNHGAIAVYAIQSLLNFFMPTGAAQAALSLPILGPMGDLLGITRQTSVLAFQLGDGISNILSPLSLYLMAGLSTVKIPWKIWMRWVLPLVIIFYFFGVIFITTAQSMQYGPF